MAHRATGRNGGASLWFHLPERSHQQSPSPSLSSSLSLSSSRPFDYSTVTRVDYSSRFISGRSIRRSVLALKSDPLKPRVDQIRKQADDHRMLVLTYASYARKLKLENSKMLRIFADLSQKLY
ncbi:hypothetical protein Nepgr_027685 [Nepenthes gracilis]|uniref:Uncharacterized protein n=1 Tax=Nepenthes gracilis TaxID=150966 RepID=A0AAD3Y1F5_NEPGR|nr:hypothetical protein Nepgr_027685 [Nepenthes gracilis]